MRLNSKVAVFVAVASLVLATTVATAFAAAAQENVALQVGDEMGSGYAATYGGEIILAPAVMSKIELPKDKFTFQVYVQDSADPTTGVRPWVWKTFQDFEDIALEDTNTVAPFSFSLGKDDLTILTDGTPVSPITLLTTATVGSTPFTPTTRGYMIRAEYKPLGSSSSPASYSETEFVQVIQEDSTKVTIAPSKTIRRAGTTFSFTVSPDCGVGTVRVTVTKAGTKALTYNLTTNEAGKVTAKLKLGTKNGTYKVSAKFLGNDFGVASPTASKSIKATR
jgi:hypothetical protein